MVKYTILILLFIINTSCKTISINKDTQKTTQKNVFLGAIGEQKKRKLKQSYSTMAWPRYTEPVRVQVNPVMFNKLTYKAFKKANLLKSNMVKINYIDSVKAKPKFLNIEIVDKVGVLKALNNNNQFVFKYLQNKKTLHLVASISIAFNKNIRDILINAEEVFLEQSGANAYVLKIYKNKTEQNVIYFNSGTVFTYQPLNACWKGDKVTDLEIADLVKNGSPCPRNTYRFTNFDNKKINYFKL